MNRRLVITAVAAAALAGAVAPSFASTAQPVPVVVQHDDNGTTVGVGDVGVNISPSGRVCPEVSTQSWQCIGGDR